MPEDPRLRQVSCASLPDAVGRRYGHVAHVLDLVLFQNSIERSCRFSVVMAEDSAEPFTSGDPPWRQFWNALDQGLAGSFLSGFWSGCLPDLSGSRRAFFVSLATASSVLQTALAIIRKLVSAAR